MCRAFWLIGFKCRMLVAGYWYWLLVLVAGTGCWYWLLVLVAGTGCWYWLLVSRFAVPAPVTSTSHQQPATSTASQIAPSTRAFARRACRRSRDKYSSTRESNCSNASSARPSSHTAYVLRGSTRRRTTDAPNTSSSPSCS